MEKTKIKGIYYDSTHNTYTVRTTFTSKDKYKVQKCKRGFTSLKKAEIWKNEQYLKIKDTNYHNNQSVKMNLDEAITQYVEYKVKQVKPSTIYGIEKNLRHHLINYFGSKKVSDIRIPDVMGFQKYLQELSIEPQTKNKLLSLIVPFFEWCNLIEAIPNEIYHKIKLLLQPFKVVAKSKNDFLELEEFKELMATYTEEDKIHRLAYNLLFFTGVRLGELLAIQYKDVDTPTNEIDIYKQAIKSVIVKNYKTTARDYSIELYTKTNTVKVIVIPQWLTDMILEFKQIQNASDDDYIFLSGSTYITEQSLREDLKKHLAIAGLKQVRLHDFRHSNVSLLYDLGADAKYVQQRMGHSSPKTSQDIYEHITRKRQQSNDDLIKKIEQI